MTLNLWIILWDFADLGGNKSETNEDRDEL